MTTVATTISGGLRRFIAAVEPWYDSGEIHVERMQEIRINDGGRLQTGGEGPVRYLQIQWLGIHLGFQIGRTPKPEGR
ncbi:hypothetical protein QP166_15040 [Sphingomonas sp. LR60]|uniref:hypothetical protein n=1 Tax=Sphingomonas sp. LR60 TaxID=3050233 RepID=UPI002FDF3BE7